MSAARLMQETAPTKLDSVLGYGGSEVFPKQRRIKLQVDDTGNFLNLPYFNGDRYNKICSLIEMGVAVTSRRFF